LKEAFFAQYWGQRVLSIEGDAGIMSLNQYGTSSVFNNLHKFYLELKPLSSISEEDLEGLLPTEGCCYNEDTELMALDTRIVRYGRVRARELDYLRSKGYFLPFMGITVEEIICMGWGKFRG